jgi:aminoglycoside 6'-N-acetyltransferase I
MIARVRLVRESEFDEWLRLRQALWPDSAASELREELAAIWARREYEPVFVAERLDGSLGGMIEVSLHETADGCTTSPVGYIEGWYIDPDLRRQGVGGRLVAAAEAWAREAGCREMASDTEPRYPISPLAHRHLGYEETETPLHYCKKLLPPEIVDYLR